ncbi:hypothetical protein JCM8097_001674 [Rhodosporidiobolus ruineniae]
MTARTDRTSTALRPLSLSQGSLHRADGSALFSFGNVSVLASLTGPAEVRIRDELVDRATLEIHVRPLRGQGGPATRAQELTLRQLLTPLILLHLYPRALLQLTLQTVSSPSTAFSKPFSTEPSLLSSSDDLKGKGKGREKPQGVGAGAGEKAARVNAAMMALVDAGVQCRGMLVAVAVAFLPSPSSSPSSSNEEEEELRVDPSPAEEEQATSTHIFAFSFGVGVGGAQGTCVGVDSVGSFSEAQLDAALALAHPAASTLLAFLRRSVETKYGASGAPAPAAAKVKPAPAPEAVGRIDDDEQEEEGSDDEVMIDA